jgi:hypothetical protein
MFNFHAELHMPSSTDSLVTDIKPETKENIRTAAILLF